MSSSAVTAWNIMARGNWEEILGGYSHAIIWVLARDLLYCVKMPLAQDSSTRSGGGTGASTNKHFGHGAPVSEGRAVSSVDGGCSSSVGLSVKEFTNSDIANGLRFPLNLKLQEIEVIKWHVPAGVLWSYQLCSSEKRDEMIKIWFMLCRSTALAVRLTVPRQ